MEKRHSKLLSKQSQPKPPQSNSKFGVGRPQPNSKFGVELPYPNSKFGVGESQQSSAHLWGSMRAHCQAIDIKEALVGRQPNFYLSNFIFLVLSCFIRFIIMWSHKINIKIENGIKNSRRKITPWRSICLAFKRQNRAWFWHWTPRMGASWRWTPRTSMVLAFNARNG